VTLADNQHELSRQLDERGLIRWLGRAETATEAMMATALRHWIENPQEMRVPPEDLVDGCGVERIVEIMQATY